MFHLGYNTNGLPHHRVADALELLAELGYAAVSLTPDAGLLDPYDLRAGEVEDVRRRAEDLGLALTVETGTRFLLDPRRKHFPTLLEEAAEDRARRVDFLERCVRLAAELGASHVSFWAGRAPGGEIGDGSDAPAAPDEPWDRLVEGTRRVLAHGREHGVRVAFEPEPGMFIERPLGYEHLCHHLGSLGDHLGLTLDVGHCLVTGDLPVAQTIRDFAHRLVHVHLDDIAGGVHEHLPFGGGDLDLASTCAALIEVGFDGMAAVELSRQSHQGAAAAAQAMQALRDALGPHAGSSKANPRQA